jgi:hypothetical protein
MAAEQAKEEVARMYLLVSDIEKRLEVLEKSKQERGKLRFSLSNTTPIAQPQFESESANDPKGDAGRTINLEIQVKNAKTDLGWRVYVVGGVKELGSWDTTKAVSLSTTSQTYPDWSATINISNYGGAPITLKFCKRTENDPSAEVQWDNHPDYTFTVPQDSNVIKKVIEWRD